MQTLLLWLFYISTFYAFIPGIVSRLFGFRVFRKGSGKADFALTFDDGPDPKYTPRLLDLLNAYGAKATFFVVGAHAEKNPELIRRMHEEGHLIGIHNYEHKTNWLMRPAAVKRQIERTSDIIYRITGERPTYYRPPWGIVNLFDFSKSRQVKIVLWSAMFGDWREKLGADRLTEKMFTRLRPGEVMLLHDCGTTPGADPEAPEQMLMALGRALEEAERRGLRSIRVDEMIRKAEGSAVRSLSFGKRLLVGLWLGWEKLFHAMFQLKTVHPEDPFLHYRLRDYQGHTVTTDEGVVLTKNDPIIELHIDNRELFEMGVRSRSTAQLAIRMIRRMERDLPALADQVVADPRLLGAKALYGVSMINRGPEKFGFSVLDLPDGLFARSTTLYLRILMSVIHPAGGNRLKERSDLLVPKMMLMPISTLLSRTGRSVPHPRRMDEPEEAGVTDGITESDLTGAHVLHHCTGTR
ncbi:polysaccharide deacetylase family protein [Paenibacillus sp. CN-4]|uniref:polysaccharide deacetylase family protein n=1 Tax=Paenibacillus nanchangensis TaxID=3348343 RepID=UPI00397B8E1A